MKKLLSLMLVVLMMVTICAPGTLIASAAGIDDSLIFSMSVSEGEDGEVVLADTAGTAAATFTSCGAEGYSVGTIEGKGTKYFKAGTVKNAAVYASDSEFKEAFKNDVTVEMWSKSPDTVSGFIAPLGYYGATSAYATNYNMLFQYNSSTTAGQVLSYQSDKGTNAINISANLAEWTHWVITRTYNAEGSDGNYGTMTLYRNGETVNSVTLTEPMWLLDIQNYLYIGQGKKDGTASGASIGALNVYSGIMTQAEAKAKHDATVGDYTASTGGDEGGSGEEGGEGDDEVITDPSGLVFSLDLSDAQNGAADASTIKDAALDSVEETVEVLSGKATVGTIEGKTTKYIQSTKGTANSGITVKDAGVSAAFMKDVTVEVWAKAPASLTAYTAPFSYWSSGRGYNMLFQYNSQTQGLIDTRNSGGTKLASVTANVDDLAKWTHWVITRTYNSSATASPYGTMTVYKDGEVVDSKSITGALEGDANFKLYLGLGKDSGSGSGVQIGAFNVYNKVLTESEVAANYDATIGNYYNIDTTGLVFNMDLSAATVGEDLAAGDITDSTADLTDETITFSGVTPGAISGTNKKYVQVGTASGNGIKVQDANVAAAFEKDVTVEMWSKAPSAVSGYVGAFAYAGVGSDYNKGHNMLFQYNASTTAGQAQTKSPASNCGTVSISNTDLTQWTHWVVTRTYNSSATAAPYGEMIVYRNGVKVGNANITAVVNHLIRENYLYIGYSGITSSGGTAAGSGASIATMKVYNRVLTEAAIASKFRQEASDFGYDVANDVSIDGGVSWSTTGGTAVVAINKNLTSLKADFTVMNNTSSPVPVLCVLAMYDAQGNLVAVDTDGIVSVTTTQAFSYDLGTITPTEGCYARLFVWNGTNLTPYTDGGGLLYSSQDL